MLGIFNRKNKKKELRTVDTGLNGKQADIRTAAQMDGDWQHKEPLLKGCLAAFEQGRPQNLQTFLMAYLEFKRANGGIGLMETQGMDAGLTNLVGRPLVHLLERQKDPARVLAVLTQDMSAYYTQLVLDIGLRHGANHHSWMVVPVLLDAGADINTGRGRPLFSALRNGNLRMAALLRDAGADIDMSLRLAAREDDEDSIKAATTLRLLRGEDDSEPQDSFETGTPPAASAPRTIIKKQGGHTP